jgi:radical SAM superfamily enzyme YgiQ (UPF0313 family)
MNVVLIVPPVSPAERYGDFGPLGSRLFNTGLLWLAAVARDAGHRISILDAAARGWDVERTAAAVAAAAPDVCGVTATTPAIESTERLCARLRSRLPRTVLVLGGAHVTSLPHETMDRNPALDFAVVGEGEITFVELLNGLRNGDPVSELAGVVDGRNGVARVNPRRALIPDLDSLPLPAWDLLPDLARNYWPTLQCIRRLPSSILITSRGCGAHCTFCDRSLFGNRARFHGPEYVLSMMETLARSFGVRDFAIHDENFLENVERAEAICARILNRRMNVSWSCQGRADVELTDEQLALMRRAGCWQILVGIESANERVLRCLAKQIDLAEARSFLARVRKFGMRTKGFFMIGAPCETEESLEETKRFALAAPFNDIQVTLFTPFPGAPLTPALDKYGVVRGTYAGYNEYGVSFVPHGLDEDRLQQAQRAILAEFYFRWTVVLDYVARMAVCRPWRHAGRLLVGLWRIVLWRRGGKGRSR